MKHNLFYFLFLILRNLFYYTPTTTAFPIINGLPDNHHYFKYNVAIYNKLHSGSVYEHVSGGSIISERYILTAAHCFISKLDDFVEQIFYPVGLTKIIAGTNHINGPGIERDIIRAFIPLEYNVNSKNHPDLLGVEADIAVAELSADLGVHQQPDRLAIIPLEALDPHSNVGVNEQATFCGFGPDTLLEHSDGHLYPAQTSSTINRFMNVKILGRDKCIIFNTRICAVNSDERVFRTPSYGDSGAGLVYNNKIVGVLSSGPRLGRLEPIKFTRLYDYMRFIEEAQNPHGDHRFMMVLDATLRSPLKGHRNPKHPGPHGGSSSSSAESYKKPPQAKHYQAGLEQHPE